jgi:hypothetical protein
MKEVRESHLHSEIKSLLAWLYWLFPEEGGREFSSQFIHQLILGIPPRRWLDILNISSFGLCSYWALLRWTEWLAEIVVGQAFACLFISGVSEESCLISGRRGTVDPRAGSEVWFCVQHGLKPEHLEELGSGRAPYWNDGKRKARHSALILGTKDTADHIHS